MHQTEGARAWVSSCFSKQGNVWDTGQRQTKEVCLGLFEVKIRSRAPVTWHSLREEKRAGHKRLWASEHQPRWTCATGLKASGTVLCLRQMKKGAVWTASGGEVTRAVMNYRSRGRVGCLFINECSEGSGGGSGLRQQERTCPPLCTGCLLWDVSTGSNWELSKSPNLILLASPLPEFC